MRKKRKTIGLALGGGTARGLAHIGVLKVLHKHKIFPDYIAGTSMGAVIGSFYAAGYTPEELEEFAKTAKWKKFVDFAIPKAGLIKGAAAERKIRSFLKNKKFKDLNIKLNVVAYNLDKQEEVIFDKGDVTRAVRASMSIPGIFAPAKINNEDYIDGAVCNPTPFDVVKEMGADIVIAVDLYNSPKVVHAPDVKEENLMSELKHKLVAEELLNIRNYIIPKRWPKFIRTILIKIFDKLLYPAKVLRIATKRELPPIAKVMGSLTSIMINNLAKEKFKNALVDIKVTPQFPGLGWGDFEHVDAFVKSGEVAMKKKINSLKKRLN